MFLFIAVVLAALGIVFVIYPKASWTMSNFWRFEGAAEPSDASLVLYRLQGAGYVIGALLVLWLSSRL